MKYKLNIQKKSGFNYEVENGVLKINNTPIGEPTDQNIVEFDITAEETALGISRAYREDGEVICHLTKYVEDLDPYKSGKGIKKGKKITYTSKWDFSKLMSAEEVVEGNNV